MNHDNHFNFEVNKSLKNGKKQKSGTKQKTKQKRRNHKGFKRQESGNHRRGGKDRKLGGGTRNEQDEVIKSCMYPYVAATCCTVVL